MSDEMTRLGDEQLDRLLLSADAPSPSVEQLAALETQWEKLLATAQREGGEAESRRPASSSPLNVLGQLETPVDRPLPHRPGWLAVGLAASVFVALSSVLWSGKLLLPPRADLLPREVVQSPVKQRQVEKPSAVERLAIAHLEIQRRVKSLSAQSKRPTPAQIRAERKRRFVEERSARALAYRQSRQLRSSPLKRQVETQVAATAPPKPAPTQIQRPEPAASVEPLLAQLGSLRMAERHLAAQKLAAFKDPQTTTRLIELVSYPAVRNDALRALAMSQSPLARQYLRSAVVDPMLRGSVLAAMARGVELATLRGSDHRQNNSDASDVETPLWRNDPRPYKIL